MSSTNDETTNEIEAPAQKITKLLGKIKQCQELPAADLAGKYRKAYNDLIRDAVEAANEYRDLIMYGGFLGNWIDGTYAYYAELLHEQMQTPDWATQIAAGNAAIRAGDFKGVHEASLTLRGKVAAIVEELGGTADLAFVAKMYLINLEEN